MKYFDKDRAQTLAELLAEYANLQSEYDNREGASRIYEKALEELEARIEQLRTLPPQEQLAAREPDGYEEILAQRPEGPRRLKCRLDEAQLREKMAGAVLGRFAACMLGVPVEGWQPSDIQAMAKQFGDAFPPVDYWSGVYYPERLQYDTCPRSWYARPNIHCVCVDDDINYSLVDLMILEQYGFSFTTQDVGEFWKAHLDVAYTAERAALDNLKAGVPAQEAAIHHNPYVQWIGADIRSDGWAWACAGNPEKAAGLAWRDAWLTHRRNGIYGEMYFAAVQAAVFETDTILEALELGLTEIPAQCTLAQDIRWAISRSPEVRGWEDARKLVDERFAGMNSVHTNNNACLTIFALLLGKNDFTKTIGEVVAMGMDNDCTAATAGSILGAYLGKSGIPQHWIQNFNNTVLTYMKGIPELKLDDVIDRFTALALQTRRQD